MRETSSRGSKVFVARRNATKLRRATVQTATRRPERAPSTATRCGCGRLSAWCGGASACVGSRRARLGVPTGRAGHHRVRRVSRAGGRSGARSLDRARKGADRRRERVRDGAARDSNEVVLAHELLHTLGATDKYRRRDQRAGVSRRLRSTASLARCCRRRHAELMAGRIPLTERDAVIPTDLRRVSSVDDGSEIGWQLR